MRFSKRIKEYSELLNDTDRILINYILKNEAKMKDLTIREVSEENYVAYNTVVRFSKKLGYSGFSELKFSFTNEPNSTINENEITEENDCGIGIIQKTNKLLSTNNLNKLAYKVLMAEVVYAYGVGDSNYFATLIAKNLTKSDKRIIVLERLYEVDNVIKSGDENVLIIFISAGGRTEEICSRARQAIAKGIELISFTGNEESELASITKNNILFDYQLEVVNSVNISDLRGLMQAIMVFSNIYWDNFPAE